MKRFWIGSVAPAVIAYGGVYPLALWCGLRPTFALVLGIAANAAIWAAIQRRLAPREARGECDQDVRL